MHKSRMFPIVVPGLLTIEIIFVCEFDTFLIDQ